MGVARPLRKTGEGDFEAHALACAKPSRGGRKGEVALDQDILRGRIIFLAFSDSGSWSEEEKEHRNGIRGKRRVNGGREQLCETL